VNSEKMSSFNSTNSDLLNCEFGKKADTTNRDSADFHCTIISAQTQLVHAAFRLLLINLFFAFIHDLHPIVALYQDKCMNICNNNNSKLNLIIFLN